MKSLLILGLLSSGVVSFNPDNLNKDKVIAQRGSNHLGFVSTNGISFYHASDFTNKDLELKQQIDIFQDFSAEGRWTISFEKQNHEIDFIAFDLTMMDGIYYKNLQVYESNPLTASAKSEKQFNNIVFFQENNIQYFTIIKDKNKKTTYQIFEGDLLSDIRIKAKENTQSDEVLILSKLN